MSALLHLSSTPPKINHFIKPTSPFDVVSAARRLALSSEQFAAALEYTKAISRGLAGKFMDALMATLGNDTVMSVAQACSKRVPSSPRRMKRLTT